MKLYIITKGDYSEYRILAATTNKERAEKICMIFTDDYDAANIEEYEDGKINIDEDSIERPWHVIINQRGEIELCEQFSFIPTKFCSHYPSDRYGFSCQEYRDNEKVPNLTSNFYCKMLASSKEEAIKIARDKRAKIIAQYLNI